jgi:hypothetical protein
MPMKLAPAEPDEGMVTAGEGVCDVYASDCYAAMYAAIPALSDAQVDELCAKRAMADFDGWLPCHWERDDTGAWLYPGPGNESLRQMDRARMKTFIAAIGETK